MVQLKLKQEDDENGFYCKCLSSKITMKIGNNSNDGLDLGNSKQHIYSKSRNYIGLIFNK